MTAQRRAPAPSGEDRELDELTVARAQRGDPAAFRVLVQTYQQRVFSLIGRILVDDRSAVDDVAQDTFVKVHRALEGFDRAGPARLSTWILTIATRTAIDHLRRRRPGERLPDLIARGPSAEELTQIRRRVVEARAAIAELEPEQRAVIVLRAFHDLDYPEIAEALGVAPGTVKSRLSRARKALRAALARGGIRDERA